MKFDSFKISKGIVKAKPRHEESSIQRTCVMWFRYQWPGYICFAVPNGGARSKTEACIMKGEGVMAGVSDLIVVGEGRVLFVEMKTMKGKQSATQKDFQRRVEGLGHKYVVCRCLNDFISEVNGFLKGEKGAHKQD